MPNSREHEFSKLMLIEVKTVKNEDLKPSDVVFIQQLLAF